METEISINDFEILKLKEGDVVMVRPNEMTDERRMLRWYKSFKTQADEAGVKVLAVPNGVEASVLRQCKKPPDNIHFDRK